MRYDLSFIAIALACLLSGVAVGFWFMTPMGGNLALLPTHAHFNLFGWATLAICGLIHQAYPQLGRGRLAFAQFALAVLGSVCLPIGFAIARDYHAHKVLVGVGALCGAAAAILFAIMFGVMAAFDDASGDKSRGDTS